MTLAVAALLLATGFAARTVSVRLARTTSDLFTAIRPASPPLVGAGLAAEYLGGAPIAMLLLAGASNSLREASWLGMTFAAGLVALAAIAGPLHQAGTDTPGGLAAKRHPGHPRLAGHVHAATLVALVLFLVPVVQVAGWAITALVPVPLPYPLGRIIAGGLLTAAVLTFRGRGSLYAQPVRLAALVAGLGAAALLASSGHRLPQLDGAGLLPVPGSLAIMISYSVAVVAGTLAAPHLWPRLHTARDPGTARRSVSAATAVVAAVAVAAVALGSYLASVPSTVAEPSLAAQTLLGLFLGGLLSGCFAAGSALLTAAATTARRLKRGPATGIVGTSTAAVALAIVAHNIGLATLTGLAFAFTAATTAPVVLSGLWSRRRAISAHLLR